MFGIFSFVPSVASWSGWPNMLCCSTFNVKFLGIGPFDIFSCIYAETQKRGGGAGAFRRYVTNRVQPNFDLRNDAIMAISLLGLKMDVFVPTRLLTCCT